MKSAESTLDNLSLPYESQLVRQSKSGDADAFAQLYDAYVERVYRYVYFRVTDDMTAEDITSQIFLKAWEHLDRYQIGSSPFLAWLYTIARNQVIDHYRTHKQSTPLEETLALAADAPTLDDDLQNKYNLHVMRNALHFLTEEQQQVLILKFIAGLPTETIAHTMGKREGTIRALQMRALKTMAKHMEKEVSI